MSSPAMIPMSTVEKAILSIAIVVFIALMFTLIWYVLATGSEMSELGGIGAGREKSPSEIIIKAPVELPEQKLEKSPKAEAEAENGPNLSSGSSARESVSESDGYWLWWVRRANKIEDEEAANGSQSPGPSRRIVDQGSGNSPAGVTEKARES